MSRVAVLGAGAGGLSAVVELSLAGHDVRLWNRSSSTLQPHRDVGGVRYSGALGEGMASPELMTVDLAEAVSGCEVAVVCLPSVVHPQLFADLAPLGVDVPIVLNPGHTGAALHLRAVFAAHGTPLPPAAELSTLTYVARVSPDGVVSTTGRAGAVRAACLPGGEVALAWATRLFPGVQAVGDVAASSLSNVNLVLHPPGAVLGAAWVEATGGDFRFYVDAMTPGVGRVLLQLDDERRRVARALGHELPPLLDEMAAIGTVSAEAAAAGDVVHAVRSGEANARISAPDSFGHRYYQEDLAFGLLPFTVLAEVAEVDVPTARALLHLGAVAAGIDLDAGLGRERLGLNGIDLPGLRALIGS